ncbi:MAG: hypothetical protein ACOYVI_10030 [Bacillota bacterium]
MKEWGGERLREDKRWKYGVPPPLEKYATLLEESLTWKTAN